MAVGPIRLPDSVPGDARARTSWATSLLFESRIDLTLEQALTTLARQATLALPVKAVRGVPGRSGFLAEIPFEHDLARCRRAAEAALDGALRWLEHMPLSLRADGSEELRARLGEALAVLGWDAERRERDEFAVRTAGTGGPLRIRVLPGDMLRVAHLPTAFPVRNPGTLHAARLFGLEANARLRLVRHTVSSRTAGLLHIERDVLMPASADLVRWLGEAADALAVARQETARSLRALTDPDVAAAYLAARAMED